MKYAQVHLGSILVVMLALCPWLAWGGESDQPALSLANVYHENIDLGEYWVSEKLDGVRAFWDGDAFHSRRGNRYAAPDWFLEGLPGVPLDGELWMGRGTFDELSGVVRRLAPDDEAWRTIRYMVFDLPSHPGTFDERLVRLKALIEGLEAPHVDVVHQFRVADEAELMAALAMVVHQGGEGLMLRHGRSPYRPGRSDDLLKLKTHEDAEAVVVAHLPGKGKYEGMMGSLLVELPDGRRFRLGSGFTDEDRRVPPAVGATVTFKYHGKTANGIPRFASFLRIREEI
ncbi:MAG: DNA ligase [Pseudomonadales bacterium]|nr:DNA ligase [Pseudomonadales bacterium]